MIVKDELKTRFRFEHFVLYFRRENIYIVFVVFNLNAICVSDARLYFTFLKQKRIRNRLKWRYGFFAIRVKHISTV